MTLPLVIRTPSSISYTNSSNTLYSASFWSRLDALSDNVAVWPSSPKVARSGQKPSFNPDPFESSGAKKTSPGVSLDIRSTFPYYGEYRFFVNRASHIARTFVTIPLDGTYEEKQEHLQVIRPISLEGLWSQYKACQLDR